MDRTLLERKALAELRQIAGALELRGYQRMKKADLVDLIIGAGGGGNGEPSGDGDDTAASDTAASDTAASDAATSDAATSSAAAISEPSGDGAGDEGGSTAAALVARRRGGPTGGARDRGGRGGRGGEDRDDRDDRGRDGRDRDDRPRAEYDRARSGRDQDQPSGGRGPDREQPRADRDQERGDRPSGSDRDDRGEDDDGDDSDGARNRAKRERRRKNRGQGAGQPGGQHENLDEAEVREGILDLLPEGYGFLRVTSYLSGPKDVYVSQSFVRRYDLRRGDRVAGPIRRNRNNDKFPALGRVDSIEGEAVAELEGRAKRAEFKDLTPLFPTERLRLAGGENATMAMRLVDMLAPIGKGQRGLIVSPPKAGKTTILKQLAAAIEASDPDLELMVVLVDERPEEVTDFQRSTDGEVISSTFDRPAEDHTQVAELTIERAKRLAERGKDVVILLDSITRLGRAYNQTAPTSGRIMSGGMDSAALYPPKRFFGAARNIEEGGSLTIIATALIETGSKMDEVIFEEFKGTGNMELRLDRRMEQKRIFPAIDIQASGTRREELLLPQEQIDTIWKLRRLLATMDTEASLHLLIDKLKAAKTNEQFLQLISKSNLQ
ncbi:transcription termination factor Rho [Nitriliruptor alkaliphilus]|uniref:transcription termination factor Rho n=1 Tax=Nitriliruptor alkaliphilus TaxID=427918 RepID=UPI000698D11E|nr:transcription termination factor Rho [Nitriliruptor alkaliphilus]